MVKMDNDESSNNDKEISDSDKWYFCLNRYEINIITQLYNTTW